MVTKTLNYLRNNAITTIIGIFLFFVPSFDDLKKVIMEHTIINSMVSFWSWVPNLITGGILVFLFFLYRQTLLRNEDIIKDLEMMRFIADYRRFHIQSASMEGVQTNFYNTSFFTDVDFSSGVCEFKYDENERNAAKNYFIQEKGLLAKEAELISNRYYEHNTGYRKIPN